MNDCARYEELVVLRKLAVEDGLQISKRCGDLLGGSIACLFGRVWPLSWFGHGVSPWFGSDPRRFGS
jgi:hypothetical protein